MEGPLLLGTNTEQLHLVVWHLGGQFTWWCWVPALGPQQLWKVCWCSKLSVLIERHACFLLGSSFPEAFPKPPIHLLPLQTERGTRASGALGPRAPVTLLPANSGKPKQDADADPSFAVLWHSRKTGSLKPCTTQEEDRGFRKGLDKSGSEDQRGEYSGSTRGVEGTGVQCPEEEKSGSDFMAIFE